MVDEVRALSAKRAREPQSLVFLRLGELLRQRRQLDAAQRVALLGLERHPHLADAHDLYARILADRHDYERAFDEWDMTLRIAPEHTGAIKGLAFLYFKAGDLAQAESHLAAAKRGTPADVTISQSLAKGRGRDGGAARRSAGSSRPAGAAGERGAARGPGRAPLAGAGAMTAASFGHALGQITRVAGVRGAMLVSADDGLVVAEHLMEGIRGPAVAAL